MYSDGEGSGGYQNIKDSLHSRETKSSAAAELLALAEHRELIKMGGLPEDQKERREAGRVNRETYVVGDIHANINVLRAQLMLCGAIDENDNWIGKNRVVVLDGDLIDRGDHSLACLDLVENLQKKAEAGGGKLVYLIGNHEMMWMQSNLEGLAVKGNGSFEGEDIKEKIAHLRSEKKCKTKEAQKLVVEQISRRLIRLAKAGRLRPAYDVAGWLIVHGHVSEELKNKILLEAADENAKPLTDNQPAGTFLADGLNQSFREACESDLDLGNENDIFSWLENHTRLFWERLPASPIDQVSPPANHTNQIIAHTIQNEITEPIIEGDSIQIGVDINAGSGLNGLGVLRIFPDAQKYAIIEAVEIPPGAPLYHWEHAHGVDLAEAPVDLAEAEEVIVDADEFVDHK